MKEKIEIGNAAVEVEFDYEPAEPANGFAGGYALCAINGIEVDNFNDSFLDKVYWGLETIRKGR